MPSPADWIASPAFPESSLYELIGPSPVSFLSEIIEQLNTLFGGDTTDGDQLSYAHTLAEKTMESEILQRQAANNTKEQFASSPDLTSEILTAVMDSMDAQAELSTRALNSEEI